MKRLVCPKCVVEELEPLTAESYRCPHCNRLYEELSLLASYEWELRLLNIKHSLLNDCKKLLEEARKIRRKEE